MLELVAKSRFSVFTNFENLLFVTTSLFCDAVHKLKRCESGFSASWSILLCIVIPVLVLVTGIVVYLKRRYQ